MFDRKGAARDEKSASWLPDGQITRSRCRDLGYDHASFQANDDAALKRVICMPV
jgi:hypothetical protein